MAEPRGPVPRPAPPPTATTTSTTPRPSACRIHLRDRDACEGELDSVTIEVAPSASPDTRQPVSSDPSVLKPVQEADAKSAAGRRGGADDPQQQLLEGRVHAAGPEDLGPCTSPVP